MVYAGTTLCLLKMDFRKVSGVDHYICQQMHSVVQHTLIYSMVQSPSWEANWFAASQEIPCISQNPKVHYRTHKRPPPVSIRDQPNPVHIPTSHLLEIHPNIIHPSTPGSPQWSPFLRFPQQDPIRPLSSPIHATVIQHMSNLNSCMFQHWVAIMEFLQQRCTNRPTNIHLVHLCCNNFLRMASHCWDM